MDQCGIPDDVRPEEIVYPGPGGGIMVPRKIFLEVVGCVDLYPGSLFPLAYHLLVKTETGSIVHGFGGPLKHIEGIQYAEIYFLFLIPRPVWNHSSVSFEGETMIAHVCHLFPLNPDDEDSPNVSVDYHFPIDPSVQQRQNYLPRMLTDWEFLLKQQNYDD